MNWKRMNLKYISVAIVIILIFSFSSPLVSLEGLAENEVLNHNEKEDSPHLKSIKSSGASHSYENKGSAKRAYYDNGVRIESPPQKHGDYGEIISYSFKIINERNTNDTFDWSADSGRGWLISSEQGVLDLEANSSSEIELEVQVPENADAYAADRLKLKVTSQTDGSVSDEGVTYTYIQAKYGSRIEPGSTNIEGILPGEEFTVEYTLQNIGNIMDSYEIQAYVDNPYWEATPDKENTGFLEPDENTSVEVTVSVPEVKMEYKIEEKDIYSGVTKDIVLNAQAGNGIYNTTDPVPSVTIDTKYSAVLEPVEPHKTIEYSETTKDIEFDLQVRNLCNIRDEEESKVDLSISKDDKSFETEADIDEGEEANRWGISVSAPNVTLKGGEIDKVLTRVTSPRKPINGTFTSELKVKPYPSVEVSNEHIESGYGELYVSVTQRGDVSVKSLQAKVKEQPTKTAEIDFEVKNTGNGIDDFALGYGTNNNWDVNVSDESFIEKPDEKKYGAVIRGINPREEKKITLEVKIPRKTRYNHTENVTLKATSLFEENENDVTVTDSAVSVIEVEKYYSIILEPDENEKLIYPDKTESIEISITNRGNVEDKVLLAQEFDQRETWETELQSPDVDVEKWSTVTTELYVTPSQDAIHENSLNITVLGVSEGNESKMGWANVTAKVQPVPEVELILDEADPSIEPGGIAKIGLIVRNKGNANDTFKLDLKDENEYWTVNISENPVEIEAVGSTKIDLVVEAPEIPESPSYKKLANRNIVAGDIFEVMVNVTSHRKEEVSDSISLELEVNESHELSLDSDGNKKVLPGQSVNHEIKINNLGNSNATFDLELSSLENPAFVDHAKLEKKRVSVDIGKSRKTNLTVNAPVELNPYWHQEIRISVGSEETTVSTETKTEVVMMDVSDSYQVTNIGKSAEYQLSIVNLPSQGESVEEGDLLRDSYIIEAPIQEFKQEGWTITFENEGQEFDIDSEVIMFETAYESKEITVKLDTPRKQSEKERQLKIDIQSNNRDMEDTVFTTTKITWFDLIPIDISFKSSGDGREREIIFKIKSSGEMELSSIPFDLYVDDELIDYKDIERVSEEIVDSSEKIFEYKATYSPSDWRWEESVREKEIELVIDPNDELYQINAEGDADENDRISKEVNVSRYSGIPSWLPFVIIISSISIFALSWKNLRKYNFLCIPMGISLGTLFGSLVLLPSSILVDSMMINYLNIGIKIAAMVSFALFVYKIRFKLKDFLCIVSQDIVYQNKKRKEVPNGSINKEKENVKELEVNGDSDKEKESTEKDSESESLKTETNDVDRDKELEGTDKREFNNIIGISSPYLYHILLASTGAVTYISFLLLTNLDILMVGNYAKVLTNGFFDLPYSFLIPTVLFVLVFASFGFLIAYFIVKEQERLWWRILDNEEIIEELEAEAKNFVKEGGKK